MGGVGYRKRAMKPALLLTACVLLLGACRSQGSRYPVEEVRLTGATLTDNSLLAVGPDQVRALLHQPHRGAPDRRPRSPGSRL